MSDNPLWTYSLKVYAEPGVEPLLLALQDQYGADINVLLACCWLARDKKRLSDQLLSETLRATAGWQGECIQPLRRVRRYLKSLPEQQSFRDQVKALELEAEQWQQQVLWSLLRDAEQDVSGMDFSALATANLQRYCQRLPGTQRADWEGLLSELVSLIKGHQ